MSLVEVFLSVFLVLELLNVFTLYFQPQSKRGNGIGVFVAWEKRTQDPQVQRL